MHLIQVVCLQVFPEQYFFVIRDFFFKKFPSLVTLLVMLYLRHNGDGIAEKDREE